MTTKRQRGFTLIELLVVIGIISVLLAILIPVVSSMRIAAQNADSTAQVQRISAAIQLYYNEYQAYPGILPNSDYNFNGTAGTNFASAGVYANFTQSEDMCLSLIGGMVPANPTANNYRINITTAYIGSGPFSFGPYPPKRKTAFLSKRPEDLPAVLDKKLCDQPDLEHLRDLKNDSPAPEFLDKFGSDDRRPVLYMRANSGALPGLGNIVSDQWISGVSYNLGSIKAYLKPYNGGKGDVLDQGATNSEVQSYFTSTTGNSARYAGGYLLISAGPDHKYGTTDDIRFGPGGGQ